MAAFTENAVKLAGLAAALPFVAVAAGFRLRFVQAKDTNGSGARRVYRVCDLPVYSDADTGELKCNDVTPHPRSSMEEGISIVRKTMQDFFGKFAQVADNTVKITARTSVTTSVATYRYVRDNTEDFTRAALVAGAGIGGCMLGHKSNPWRRLTHGLLAAAPCTIVCYPSKFVQLCQSASDMVRDTWRKSLWNHIQNKYDQGDHRHVIKVPVLQTCENFDTISLSDFYEPDTDKFRTVDLCHAENIENLSMIDLCHSENIEKLSTVDLCLTENTEKLSTVDLCLTESAENVSAVDVCNADRAGNISAVDCSYADNIDKLNTGNCCSTDPVKTLSAVDSGNAENIEKLDKVVNYQAVNIEKLSTAVDRKADNVAKAGTLISHAESKRKHKVVDYHHVKRIGKKPAAAGSDQSNPEDKDMYSTRSS